MASERDYQANEGQKPEDNGAVELTEADRAAEQSEEERLKEEIAQLNDRILRLAAELDNTRKRAERERLDASRYAIAAFARDLLRVADSFERALAAAPEDGQASAETLSAVVAGVRITDRELMAVLERHGVKRIDPQGEKFDPHLHQAVAQTPGDAPAGNVLSVAAPGFVIGDRVLRPAMVIVSAGPAAGAANDATPAQPGARVDKSV